MEICVYFCQCRPARQYSTTSCNGSNVEVNEMPFKAKYVGLFHNKPYYTKMHINWLRLCPKGLKYVNGDIIKLNLLFLLKNINCRLWGLLLPWRYMSDPCRPYISRFCWKLIIPNWNYFGVILLFSYGI